MHAVVETFPTALNILSRRLDVASVWEPNFVRPKTPINGCQARSHLVSHLHVTIFGLSELLKVRSVLSLAFGPPHPELTFNTTLPSLFPLFLLFFSPSLPPIQTYTKSIYPPPSFLKLDTHHHADFC